MDNEIQSWPGGDNPHPVETIARELGPEGAGLVVGLMEHSRRETDSIMARLKEGDEAEIERWKDRAHAAEHRLWLIEQRFMNLLFGETSPLDQEVFA